jgi:hypothetical protein
MIFRQPKCFAPSELRIPLGSSFYKHLVPPGPKRDLRCRNEPSLTVGLVPRIATRLVHIITPTLGLDPLDLQLHAA